MADQEDVNRILNNLKGQGDGPKIKVWMLENECPLCSYKLGLDELRKEFRDMSVGCVQGRCDDDC
jgi:hypothetical protein